MNVIVDTSVFVDFMKSGNENLSTLLEESQVLIHPFVLTEIILGGSLNNKILHSLLMNLPLVKLDSKLYIDTWIQEKKIFKFGIGLVDATILYSAIENNAKLYTLDKKLNSAAKSFHLNY